MIAETTQIESVEISRLICGTNTFNGYSHFSKAKDLWMSKYFSIDKVVEVLEGCQDLGVTTMLGPVNEKTRQAQEELTRRGRKPMTWITTTLGSLDTQVLREETRLAAEWGSKIHSIHCSYVDSHLLTYKNEIEGLESLLDYTRELGMVPGVSTHRPETLKVLRNNPRYDVQFVNIPFNVMGFLCTVEVNWLARLLTDFPKIIIAIKPLAAGRLMPEEGLPFVFHNLKPGDACAVGVMSADEMAENVSVVMNTLKGSADNRQLLSTPSKSTLI